mmetsp:Transcript_16398/g.29836  ORF Transcript_16398/g.29836 Transcript_16398/m.29836 type:complete len:353 (-) Transcript_16398:217-1275(-)
MSRHGTSVVILWILLSAAGVSEARALVSPSSHQTQSYGKRDRRTIFPGIGMFRKGSTSDISDGEPLSDDKKSPTSSNIGNGIFGSLFDNVVDLKSNNSSGYQFGDLTKSAVAKITGKETYKFGDITNTVISKTPVSTFTGKDTYQFGDITNKLLKDTGRAVRGSVSTSLGGLPEMFRSMTTEETRACQDLVIKVGVVGLLSYSLIYNIFRSMLIVASWAFTCTHPSLNPVGVASISPLANLQRWNDFMSVHASAALFLEPILLVFRVGFAILLTPFYGYFVALLQNFMPFKKRKQLILGRFQLNRILALSTAFLFGNCLSMFLLTTLGIKLVGSVIGVPALPFFASRIPSLM